MCFINTSCTIHSADADLPAVPRSKIMGHSSHRFEDLLGFSCCTEAGLSPPSFQWCGATPMAWEILYIKFGCTSYAIFNLFPGLYLDVSLCWRLWQLQHPPRDPGIPIRQACYRNNIILTTSADSQLGAERSGAWNVALSAWAHNIE